MENKVTKMIHYKCGRNGCCGTKWCEIYFLVHYWSTGNNKVVVIVNDRKILEVVYDKNKSWSPMLQTNNS